MLGGILLWNSNLVYVRNLFDNSKYDSFEYCTIKHIWRDNSYYRISMVYLYNNTKSYFQRTENYKKTSLKLVLKTSTLKTLSCKNQIHPRENRNRKANKDRNRVVQVRVGFIYKVCAASTCFQTPFEQSASL